MAPPLSRFGLYLLVVIAGLGIATQVQPQFEPRADSISTALRVQLQTPDVTTIVEDLNWPLLNEFYASVQYRPLWVNPLGPISKASQWRHFLQTANREGLDPMRYHPGAIAEHWQSEEPWELASLDLLLTDAFLRYSVDVSHGYLGPGDVDILWDIPRSKADPLALLRSTLIKADFNAAVRDLAPSHLGYQRLRKVLAQYQEFARLGGWPPLASGKWLEYGSADQEVEFLRKRLMIEGDLQLRPVRDEQIYDRALKHAVERFQVRHGLKMDGIIGPATREAMNVPVNERIEQIKLNMDRWRWLPRELGKRYIMVNTAGYELIAMESNRPVFTMWVIIGTPERPTPVISGKLHTVVFNPYWTVPPTILFEDMLPAQKKNPDFLPVVSGCLPITVKPGNWIHTRSTGARSIKNIFPMCCARIPVQGIRWDELNSCSRINIIFTCMTRPGTDCLIVLNGRSVPVACALKNRCNWLNLYWHRQLTTTRPGLQRCLRVTGFRL